MTPLPHKLPPGGDAPAPLRRCLGPAGVLFLTLSATTPASSVFVIVPGMFAQAGTGAVWAMLVAGLVGVATALVYAELSSAFPIAGGEYVMVARTLGPLAGFVVLGVNAVNNLIFVPVVALGVAETGARLLPGLPAVPVAVVVTLAATACALLDVRTNARVTGAFLLVEVAALAVVTAVALAAPARPLLPLLAAPVAAEGAVGIGGVGLAATVAVFALNGYGMAVYFGEEMDDAAARIAPVVLRALGLTVLLELVPLVAALVAAPDLALFLAAPDPFGGLVATLGGGALARWVAAGVVVAILNAAIVSLLAFARFFYATGRDRCWGGPVDRLLCAVHPRLGSPWVATLLTGGLGVAACFVDLDLLLVLSGAGLLLTYAALALATLAGRRSGATAHARWRMPGGPAAPLFTLAATAGIVWATWSDTESGRPSLVALGVQVALAAGWYLLVLRRRGVWVVRDPGA